MKNAGYDIIADSDGKIWVGMENDNIFWIHDGTFNVQYRIILDRFNEEWSRPSVQNSATYTILPSGEYKFMVQSRSESINWSDHTAATFNFTVDAPFWMTPWFWLVGLSLISFIIYIIISIKLNKLERNKLSQLVDKKTHHLQEALDEKVVLLKKIHHLVKKQSRGHL